MQMWQSGQWGKGFLFALLAGLVGGPVRADEKAPAKPYPVKVIQNIAYYEGKDADPKKHKLDLYLPQGKKDFPVMLFVHGGAWKIGDKGDFGMYAAVGKCFAGQGIGVVVTNYRLTPKVTHPGHIQDVARAFAWTYRNIKKYGGRPDALFVCGHSAGGHLVALLGTNESYLKAQGLTLKAIRGDIPISGVFRINGSHYFDGIFPADPAARKEASPIANVRAGDPPFLILCADKDLPLCGKADADRFCAALKDKKDEARALEIKDRNHMTILLLLVNPQDPATKAILDFIHQHTPPLKHS